MPLIPFANSDMVVGAISRASNQADDNAIWQNNDSNNLYYEAQKRADMYMKLKDRRPMVFEYLQTGDPEKWVSITMYINPDKLSVAHQKVKAQQITRGGIFYQHWGDNHPVLSLSGTTGMSGMKGIEVLENIYHASGTLLRYQNFGPSTYGSANLSTIDNNVIVKDVNINSPTSVVNAAASSSSRAYVDNLKQVVGAYNNTTAAWKEYIENKRVIESAQKSNANMTKYNQDNIALRAKYRFPDGTGQDNGTADDLQGMVSWYQDQWNRYIQLKNDATWALDNGATLDDPNVKDWHDELISMRSSLGFEPDVENGTYTLDQLKNQVMPEWINAAKQYVQNKINWENELKNINADGGASSTKVDLTTLISRNKELKDTYGFPDGTYLECKAMNPPTSNGPAANATQDLTMLTTKLLDHYQGTTIANDLLKQISAVDDALASYKNTKPSLNDYTNEALTRFKEISGLDSSIITQLAYQRSLYYSQELSNSGNSSLVIQDSPIAYDDDVNAKLSAITADRAAALSQVMSDMQALEQREYQFFQDLRSNAMDDIMDDIHDEWKPRRIFVYYENRVYIGHFDSFTYSRDAANPLLIRYDMRLTIEKQVIGSSL